MFKNFTTAIGERWSENWWQRRVQAFGNRNHNVALPEGGNHTPREDEVEEVETCRLPQREIGF